MPFIPGSPLSFDAVKHLVVVPAGGATAQLDLELYPYLPRVEGGTTSAGDYGDPAVWEGGMNTGRRCCWNITLRN